jgi:UDP-N-acetylglucosamine--N-acetylmuramyl-(pentapeptide) pyrophosphoryl-undecaprenol N-acetylglucosamine transferase
MKKVVFTGGHHNSALVVALELKRQGYDVYWVGHKFTSTGDKSVSAEYLEVTKNNIPFFELKTGKVYKKKSPFEYIKVFFGFVQAFVYLLRLRPAMIVSFGGYLSVPVVLSGWALKIPSVLHEQTVTSGWANKAVAPFVKKIFLAHQSSLVNFDQEKAMVVGLPLRKGITTKYKYKKPKTKIIYITCGKQGSHIINSVVFKLIPLWTQKYKVIHQTGANTEFQDSEKARRLKANLPKYLRKNYTHKPYFFEDEAVINLKTASVVISRAGAHTVYELMYLGKRSVLIPIPWVSHNEQYENAKLLEQYGSAKIIEEENLTPEVLNEVTENILKKPPVKTRHLVSTNASELIVKEIMSMLRQ